MGNYLKLSVLTYLALVSVSCVKSTEPGSPKMVAYQVPGCTGGLGKAAAGDSCFSYRFENVLYVDFCAWGNCCPDSNRFAIESEVQHDTIFITVADTAAPLCRCMCIYVLHVELNDLPFPSYMFVCRRQDYSSRYIIYAERVFRKQI
jgi:hypothetical protein